MWVKGGNILKTETRLQIRLTKETKEKFDKAYDDSGLKNDAFIKKLIELYEKEKASN
jgi:glucan phosphoethanolaminetransferase (alkaline phosphatase superfamily)